MTKLEDFLSRDYSRIFDPHQISIHSVWLLFKAVHLKNGTYSESQMEDLKVAFYAGFTECFKIVSDYAAGIEESEAMALLDRLCDEGSSWVDRMVKKHGQE